MEKEEINFISLSLRQSRKKPSFPTDLGLIAINVVVGSHHFEGAKHLLGCAGLSKISAI